MPIENYGVLKGNVLDGRQERYDNTPHYQILVKGENNLKYRVAVNVMSRYRESEVLYLEVNPYKNRISHLLQKLPYGFTPIEKQKEEIGLDYVRGNLTKHYGKMVRMPHNKPGPKNDLNDFFQSYVNRAKSNNDTIYVFGSLFGPEDKYDPIFHFHPMQGIHNVHMNQGNGRKWEEDNGIWQDGGILIQRKDRWIGIFLAFYTQSFHTDEKGNPI